jgi:membrane protease YdiL (CAAX protease family)
MVTPAGPRWAIGSLGRIAHATILGLLQPVVPIAFFVGLGSMLFDGEGALVPPGPLTFAVVALVAAVALALLVGGGLVALGRVSPANLGLRRDRFGRELLLGVVGLAVYLACFAAIVSVSSPDADRTFRAVLSQSPAERALFLLVGMAIAFYEEPVFRGYLQPALIERLGFPGGVAVTALVFAAWHPPHFNVTGFFVRLSLGLVTGLLRGRDRPLTAALTAHALLWAVLGLS